MRSSAMLGAVALILALGCGAGSPLIEVFEDGTVTLDGKAVELADLTVLAERPADSPPVRVKIHGDTPVKYVSELQTRLQESGIRKLTVETE